MEAGTVVLNHLDHIRHGQGSGTVVFRMVHIEDIDHILKILCLNSAFVSLAVQLSRNSSSIPILYLSVRPECHMMLIQTQIDLVNP